MTKFITNQNIEIHLELASLGDRILAFIIDALIIGCYLIFISAVVGAFGLNSTALLLLFYTPAFFYTLAFETFMHGQSPGKSARDIKVVKLDGGAPGIGNYLLRWILRPIDIILYGAVAMLSIIITKNGQRLGDLAAGTTVIKLRKSTALSDIRTLKREDNYVINFPQVKRLSDKQVEVIRNTVKVGSNGFNDPAIIELAAKVKEVLQIETDLPNVKFLYTIIADYEHLE